MANVNDIVDIAPGEAPRERLNQNNAIIRSLLALALTSGGGGSVATVSSVNVAANASGWVDTGVELSGEDTLIMEASGAISHNSTDPLYGPTEGQAELRAVFVTDGVAPDGDAPGQVSYRVQRAFVNRAGRVFLWIRDVGGKGDNRGSFDVVLTHYQGAIVPLMKVVLELSARVGALENK